MGTPIYPKHIFLFLWEPGRPETDYYTCMAESLAKPPKVKRPEARKSKLGDYPKILPIDNRAGKIHALRSFILRAAARADLSRNPKGSEFL
jgi:hypothetical protein